MGLSFLVLPDFVHWRPNISARRSWRPLKFRSGPIEKLINDIDTCCFCTPPLWQKCRYFCRKSTEVDWQVDHVYSSQSVDWQRFSRLSRLSQSMVRQVSRSYAQRLTPGTTRRTSSGRETATSGLTETANTAIWISRWRIRKRLDGSKVLPVTCDVERSLAAEPEVVFRTSPDVL